MCNEQRSRRQIELVARADFALRLGPTPCTEAPLILRLSDEELKAMRRSVRDVSLICIQMQKQTSFFNVVVVTRLHDHSSDV